ncbi:Biopolymer transport protein exbD [Chromobacterium violaceum]|uniref:Biopolymer transport protein exbD n=1 Tax=Chromobacterium violaceum TaxID=536 RepID=A0A447TC05_CHRVL|nr:Biopolymer transport protein exbD [Chromobacterium violaceum]
MAMNVGSSGEDDLMMEINTTPLIDVMLVMLIMLIITIPIQTHAVKLDMPVNTPSKVQVKPVVVQIDIAPDNGVMWNGERLANREALEAKLSAAGSRSRSRSCTSSRTRMRVTRRWRWCWRSRSVWV